MISGKGRLILTVAKQRFRGSHPGLQEHLTIEKGKAISRIYRTL